MSYSRKRKHSPSPTADPYSDPHLFIQAHEADIVHGLEAKLAAESLEVRGQHVGSALIRLFGDKKKNSRFMGEDDDVAEGSSETPADDDVWVDRYDARLLLDREEYEELRRQKDDDRASSPDGWSDLPSDTEDTFFFSPEEAEDYRRDKRRRLMEETREKRLKARMEEDGDTHPGDEDPWGDSDEEPDEAEKEIMRRTAKHISTSPNPGQLEMRILANHGNDKRFAFLRGRWRHAWQIIKGKARMEQEKEKKKPALLGGLAAYGDSSGDEDSEGGPSRGISEQPESVADAIMATTLPSEPQPGQPNADDDATAKEARRTRAKEWMAKRKAA
ncbi:hypothetical protein V5O48_012601 [Marasmius crinis-equi]|uniref:Suppressor of white apricot N-terminal domain-containing protein n=1 Tax=Marasmius crinis-equi TaxID=585013 RepID=A0ABR3F2D7_9AGAR